MITISLEHPEYQNAFKDCEVGDEKTITFVVTKKTPTELTGELDSYESDDETASDDKADAGEKSYTPPASSSKSKAPRGVVIAIGKMK